MRFPEGGANRWLVLPPMIRGVVSNRIIKSKKTNTAGVAPYPGKQHSSNQWSAPALYIPQDIFQKEVTMDKDINYYGIILLLRKLRDNGLFTEKELRKVASRIAAENSIELIISL